MTHPVLLLFLASILVLRVIPEPLRALPEDRWAEALRRSFGLDDTLENLERATLDDDPQLRYLAARRLGTLGTEQARKLLSSRLDAARDLPSRVFFASGLLDYDRPEAASTLQSVCATPRLTTPERRFQLLAAERLAEKGNTACAEFLLDWAADAEKGSTDVLASFPRLFSTRAAPGLTARATELLRERLGSDDQMTIVRAAEALAAIEGCGALPAIRLAEARIANRSEMKEVRGLLEGQVESLLERGCQES